MNETKKILMTRYKDIDELMSCINSSDERYENLLEEQDKLRNEMIKLNQIEAEAEIKKAQIEAENTREKKRNLITIGTFTVTTILSACTIIKTFKFDEDGTITSTLGRGTLNGVIPKLFKR